MKTKFFILLSCMFVAMFTVSCDKDEPETNDNNTTENSTCRESITLYGVVDSDSLVEGHKVRLMYFYDWGEGIYEILGEATINQDGTYALHLESIPKNLFLNIEEIIVKNVDDEYHNPQPPQNDIVTEEIVKFASGWQDGVFISDLTAKFFAFSGQLDVFGADYKESFYSEPNSFSFCSNASHSLSGYVEVFFVLVDKDVDVEGVDEEMMAKYHLQLKKGWNVVGITVEGACLDDPDASCWEILTTINF